jgi:lipopolysaccharide transport system permease protein
MTLLLIPYLIILIGLLGLGFGLIISSITTKYRDMRFLIQFGIQLWMYATPIIYPLNVIEGNLRTVVLINPVTSIVEAFKYGFFGEGEFNILYLAYSSLFTLIILLFGVVIFNKTEQNFMDTV